MNILITFTAAIAALIGWFGFKSVTLLIIGTGIYVIDTILRWQDLNAGAKLLDWSIFAVGCIVASFLKIPFYIGGMFAINCYSFLLSIPEMLLFISFLKSLNKK